MTSRWTFSAAQLLVSHLEYNTRAIFVGSPTGARPTHYGDARSFVLNHSKLGVRISSIRHASPLAVDGRKSVAPHYSAPFSSADHFSGHDPALAVIAGMPAEIGVMELFEHTLREGGGVSLYFLLIKELSAPNAKKRYYVDDLIVLANRLAGGGEIDLAQRALNIASFAYSDDPNISAAIDALSK